MADATSRPPAPPAMFTAVPATTDAFVLGEGPVWDGPRERLLWVDVAAGLVLEGVLDGERIRRVATHEFGSTVGAVVAAGDATLLVAAAQTLVTIAPDGTRAEIARVLPAGSGSRLNDGGCDPAGRFLVGSLALDGRTGQELLVRLDGRLTTLDADLTLSNGLAWSPHGDAFYSVDSVPGVIRVRAYDAATGDTGPRRDLFTITDGTPDGLCVDVDGNLWVAIWGAGQVRCFTPGGQLLAVVEVDAPHTSSVAFAGRDRDILVITTARAELSDTDLDDHPDSGRLFVARVGVTGLPVPPWAGPPS